MSTEEDIDWRQQLLKHTDLTEKQAADKIDEKMSEHHPFVDEGSAAILAADDLDVDLVKKVKDLEELEIDIENIVPGMNSLDMIGFVHRVKDEYNPDDRDFKVRSVVVEDETAKTEISFWNEDADQAAKLSQGLKLEVENAYTKKEIDDWQEKTYGLPGVQLGDDSKVTVYNNEGESVVIVEKE